jgi:hypothetical protein
MAKMNGFELSRELVKIDPKPKMCFFTAFDMNLAEAQKVFPTIKTGAFMKNLWSSLRL